jgi:hypothetical protein
VRSWLPRRRVAFPAVVVGLFVTAVVYVSAVTPDPAAPERAVDHDRHAADQHGLSDSRDGYVLTPLALPAERGDVGVVAFRIVGPDGSSVTGYEHVLTEPLHLYVVREDLNFYQHLHPTLAGDTWTAAVRVPDGGVYRLYVEFMPTGRADNRHPVVLGVPFVIAGDTRYDPLPEPVPAVDVGGLTVRRLDGVATAAARRPDELRFQVLDARGVPVGTLQPYLGTYAHVSAFDVATGGIIHLHPTMPASRPGPPGDGLLTFRTEFPQRGRYRLFLQFKAADAVHQAAFTVVVA